MQHLHVDFCLASISSPDWDCRCSTSHPDFGLFILYSGNTCSLLPLNILSLFTFWFIGLAEIEDSPCSCAKKKVLVENNLGDGQMYFTK